MQMTTQEAMNHAIELHNQNRLKEAEAIYRQVLAVEPHNADALYLMGMIAALVGRHDVAITLIRQAINVSHPHIPHQYLVNLSCVYLELGDVINAENVTRQALEADPTISPLWNNLGNSLYLQGKFMAAAEAYLKSYEFDQSYGGALSNWANIMQETGKIREAMAAHKKSFEIDPSNNATIDNYLRDIGFLPDIDPIFIRNEHSSWAETFEKTIDPSAIYQYTGNNKDPDKRLKIGFISTDFRLHSIAYFIEPLLRNFDFSQYEIYCYSSVKCADETTKRLQGYNTQWRNIITLNDLDAANLIHNDGIDILIELGGHTSENRCRILAYRPSPLQMTFLGYPFSTGLTECHYRITDAHSDPEGLCDDHYTEKLLRLPNSTWCFQPPAFDIPVAPIPALKNGFVTFGSFNTYNKINDAVLQVWCQILNSVPHSRLLIKSHGLGDEVIQNELIARLQSFGLDPSRVDLHARTIHTQSHLELYSQVDIALDTTPYNGTTTTCEASWQGVPVVTLEGQTHVARVGYTLNTLLGLPNYIAKDTNEYVEIAKNLAGNIEELEKNRQSMRQRMLASELCDQTTYTHHFERLLRQTWQTWCATDASHP